MRESSERGHAALRGTFAYVQVEGSGRLTHCERARTQLTTPPRAPIAPIPGMPPPMPAPMPVTRDCPVYKLVGNGSKDSVNGKARAQGAWQKTEGRPQAGTGGSDCPCACLWGMEARTASMARRQYRVRGRRPQNGTGESERMRERGAKHGRKTPRKNGDGEEERACAAHQRTHPSWRACHGARQSHPRHRHRIPGRRRTLGPQSPGRHRNLGPQSRHPCQNHPGATTHTDHTRQAHTTSMGKQLETGRHTCTKHTEHNPQQT